MTPIAENPVIAPGREHEVAKKPGASEPPRIRCPLYGWSPHTLGVSSGGKNLERA